MEILTLFQSILPTLYTAWASPAFWSNILPPFITLISLLAFSSLPLTLLCKSGVSAWLLPVLGWMQFLAYLSVSGSLHIVGLLPISLLPEVTLLLVGLGVLTWFGSSRRSKINVFPQLTHTKPALFLSLVVTLFYVTQSAFYFDPPTQTIFIPGYNINHDPLTVLIGTDYIQNPTVPQNRVQTTGSQFSYHYPRAVSYLLIFISNLTKQDIYTLFPLLLVISSLFVPFVTAFILTRHIKQAQRPPTVYFVMSASLLSLTNYFTLSLVNNGFFASSMVTPFLMLNLYLLMLLSTHSHVKKPILILFSLSTLVSVFVYSYAPVAILVIACVVLIFMKKRLPPVRHIMLIGFVLTISILPPVTLAPLSQMVSTHLTSRNPEANLIGMRGNMPGYVNPLQPVSLWFSSLNYLNGQTRVGNLWIVSGLILALFFLAPTPAARPPATLVFLPRYYLWLFCVLLLGTVCTRSPYQNAKIFQQFSAHWPLILLLLVTPRLLSASLTTHRRTYSSLILVFCLMSTSALIAASSIAKPAVALDLDLRHLASQICARPAITDLTVISQSEWARHAFYDCAKPLSFPLDRTENPHLLLAVGALNQTSNFINSCPTRHHALPSTFSATTSAVLVDNCFTFSQATYQPQSQGQHWTLYLKDTL